MVLLGEALVAMVPAEAEVEVGEEAEEIGGGGEAAVLEAATVAVEVEVAVVPPVVALADVAGVTSVSGRRTFQRFFPLSSKN